MAHEIKLAGPWEFSADDGVSWTRCTLPFTPASAETSGVARCQLRRKFHMPSGLEVSSQVFVRLECDGQSTVVCVNDTDAGNLTMVENTADQSPVFDVEITSLLQQFNALTLHAGFRFVNAVQAVRVRIVETGA